MGRELYSDEFSGCKSWTQLKKCIDSCVARGDRIRAGSVYWSLRNLKEQGIKLDFQQTVEFFKLVRFVDNDLPGTRDLLREIVSEDIDSVNDWNSFAKNVIGENQLSYAHLMCWRIMIGNYARTTKEVDDVLIRVLDVDDVDDDLFFAFTCAVGKKKYSNEQLKMLLSKVKPGTLTETSVGNFGDMSKEAWDSELACALLDKIKTNMYMYEPIFMKLYDAIGENMLNEATMRKLWALYKYNRGHLQSNHALADTFRKLRDQSISNDLAYDILKYACKDYLKTKEYFGVLAKIKNNSLEANSLSRIVDELDVNMLQDTEGHSVFGELTRVMRNEQLDKRLARRFLSETSTETLERLLEDKDGLKKFMGICKPSVRKYVLERICSRIVGKNYGLLWSAGLVGFPLLALGMLAQFVSFGIPNPVSIALMAIGGGLVSFALGHNSTRNRDIEEKAAQYSWAIDVKVSRLELSKPAVAEQPAFDLNEPEQKTDGTVCMFPTDLPPGYSEYSDGAYNGAMQFSPVPPGYPDLPIFQPPYIPQATPTSKTFTTENDPKIDPIPLPKTDNDSQNSTQRDSDELQLL